MLHNDYDTMLHTGLHITSEGVGLDHITRVFKIEVDGTPAWDTSVHGYVLLPVIHEVNYG